MDIINSMLYSNPYYKKASSFKEISGIIITAIQLETVDKYLEEINRGGLFIKSPHFLIDNKGKIYQLLPENYQTHFCGGIYDKSYIQVGIACPSWIKFGKKNTFDVPLVSEAQNQMISSYTSLVNLCTMLTVAYKLNPIKDIEDDKGNSSLENIWHGLAIKQSLNSLRLDVRDAIDNGRGYYHKGIDYSYVFDPEYYLSVYPSIKQNIGTDRGKLFRYFIDYGMDACQKGCKDFDVIAYKIYNPDLVFGDNWSKYYSHYCTTGRLEGRKCV